MNQALVAFTFLAVLTFLTNIVHLKSDILDNSSLLIVNLVLCSFIIIIALFRKRLHLKIKLSLVSIIAYFALLNGLSKLGSLASSKVFIVLIPILIIFLANYKYALGALLIFLLTFLVFAYLHTSGNLAISTDADVYAKGTFIWSLDFINYIGVVWALAYAAQKYFRTLKRQLVLTDSQNEELTLHKDNLEKLVDKKTRSLTKANKKLELTIKNLKESQSKLIDAEKMASLGILTAGVAHEINNPLNYIMGAYLGLKQKIESKTIFENEEQAQELLEALKLGLDRSSHIVKGLNQFSRSNKTLDENCDIHTILDNTVLMLNNKLKNNIEVVKEFDENVGVVNGNVGNLHQVFLNILTNAIDAIDTEGQIKIKTKNRASNIVISISDNGAGITKKNLNKIATPFFTTKFSEHKKGTGLGLYITHNIIQEHKGTIQFSSEVGKGTLVEIVLPKQ